MSIQLQQRVKELEKRVEVLAARVDALVSRPIPAVGFMAPEPKRSTISLRGK